MIKDTAGPAHLPGEPPKAAQTAHPLLGDRRRFLHSIFDPATVAVIGATDRPGSVGRALVENLQNDIFQGRVLAVHREKSEVLGLPCYPSVAELPVPVDLAVVAVPAAAVPEVIHNCADAGVRSAVIISAGFRETGPHGVELEQEILKEARRGAMRIVGPNCLGIMIPRTGLNATFAGAQALPGNVAFISQSGALCTSILDWSLGEHVGFSAFVSIGSMLDVGWGDLIDYFGDDPHTHSIVLYLESVGDAGADRYGQALRIVAADPNNDGILAILSPQGMTDPKLVAREVARFTHLGKPVLASWMGGEAVSGGVALLNESGIPTFEYPDRAARAFTYMCQYSVNLKALYETPELPETDDSSSRSDQARALIEEIRASGRTLLTEAESKQLLRLYEIPVVETAPAADPEAAVQEARRIGFPVVLKLLSRTITHKSDVGGVCLDLGSEQEVRCAFELIRSRVEESAGEGHFDGVTVQPMIAAEGYELILGSHSDPQFGPVLLFGMGGQLVEVFKDSALGLPPLNTTLARRMMERTRIFRALGGIRGRSPVDTPALEKLMVRFSHLVAEQHWIREIDINPLFVSDQRQIALDARVILHDPQQLENGLPRPAIRPYPRRYVSAIQLRDRTEVTVRPIRPEDEPLMAQFHRTLSDESVYLRYMHMVKLSQRIAHERLIRMCFIDYDREMALVAIRKIGDAPEVMGVGRLTRVQGTAEAEFAVVISDRCQGLGLGSELLARLVEFARHEGIEWVFGNILADNVHMQNVSRRVGFSLRYDPGLGLIRAELKTK